MRWFLLLVAAMAVALIVVILIGDEEEGGGGDPADLADRTDARKPDDGPRPTLRGAPEGASTVPLGLRGRGGIVGRVARSGRPESALVELHHVQSFEGSDPLGVWRGVSFVGRILDSGLATGAALAKRTAGADGAFAFEGLKPGAYELRAYAEDGATVRAGASIPAAGARVEALLELPTGGETLAGRVVHADGRTFEGMVILEPGAKLTSFVGIAPRALVTTVDEEGRFEIGGLPTGPAMVSVIQPGVLRLFGAQVSLPHPGEYVLTVAGGGVERRGRVLDTETGAPIAGAGVTGGGGRPVAGILLTRTLTDAEGRFALAVPEGDGGMFVEADGYATLAGEWSKEADAETVLRLSRNARVRGRVVRKDGDEPVEGTWVFALPSPRGFMLAFPAAARTDPSGHFELEAVPPGDTTVFALGAGWTSPDLSDVQADGYNPYELSLEAGKTTDVELEVVAAGRLEGTVGTADGRAVAGAVVETGSEFHLRRQLDQLAIFGGGGLRSAVTDAEGRFQIDSLVPDVTYVVRVHAVGHPPWKGQDLQIAGGADETLDIRLAAARWLALTVLSSTGEFLAGVEVSAARRAEDGSWDRLKGVWVTDAEGRVRVGPLPPGPIGVRVTAPDHLELPFEQIAAARTEDAEAVVTVERGLALEGRVVMPEGAAAERVELAVQRVRSSGGPWIWECPLVNPSGSWRQSGLPAGTYEVTARLRQDGRRYAAERTAEAGDRTVVLELVEEAVEETVLVVRILDSEGRSVPSGRITVRTESETRSSSALHRFSNGRFETKLDPSDDARTWIEVYGVPGGRHGAAVAGPLETSGGEIEIRLPAAKTIEGTVVDADGAPVAGIRAEAQALGPEDDAWQRHGKATTDPAGRFVIPGLGDLAYRVKFAGPEAYAPVEPIPCRGGARGLRVRLETAVACRVIVLDGRGRPVVGAHVELRLPGTSPRGLPTFWGATTEQDGAAEITGLPRADRFRLKVRPPDGRKDVRTLDVSDWEPANATLRLGRAWTIRGTVVDQAGAPVARAVVQYGQVLEGEQATTWRGLETADDGTFEIEDLGEGEVELRASVGGTLPVPDASAVRVEPGATGVVLRIDRGLELIVHLKGWPSYPYTQAELRTEDGAAGGHQWEHVQEGEAIRFRGLRPDLRYAIRVSTPYGSHYAGARRVSPASGEVTLETREGGEITGRLLLPPGRAKGSFQVQTMVDGFSVGGSADEDGTFRIRGLPDGRWTLSGMQWVEGEAVLEGTVEASPGDVVEIRLVPQDR